MVCIATIPLCDKSRLHRANAAKFVSDITGIFVNELYERSKLLKTTTKRKDLLTEIRRFICWIEISVIHTFPHRHPKILHLAMISNDYVTNRQFSNLDLV